MRRARFPVLPQPQDATARSNSDPWTQDSDEQQRVTPVPLDGVGGHVLLVRADVHREGFVFPSVLFDHQVTEFDCYTNRRPYEPDRLLNGLLESLFSATNSA